MQTIESREPQTKKTRPSAPSARPVPTPAPADPETQAAQDRIFAACGLRLMELPHGHCQFVDAKGLIFQGPSEHALLFYRLAVQLEAKLGRHNESDEETNRLQAQLDEANAACTERVTENRRLVQDLDEAKKANEALEAKVAELTQVLDAKGSDKQTGKSGGRR